MEIQKGRMYDTEDTHTSTVSSTGRDTGFSEIGVLQWIILPNTLPASSVRPNIWQKSFLGPPKTLLSILDLGHKSVSIHTKQASIAIPHPALSTPSQTELLSPYATTELVLTWSKPVSGMHQRKAIYFLVRTAFCCSSFQTTLPKEQASIRMNKPTDKGKDKNMAATQSHDDKDYYHFIQEPFQLSFIVRQTSKKTLPCANLPAK